VWAGAAWATPSSERAQQSDVEYAREFNRGIEAFRRGELAEASRAFQAAYLIQPTDPKLQSWVSLVRDEQERRQAMTRALDHAKEPPLVTDETAAEETDARDPFWRRLFSKERTPLGLDQASDSTEPTRYEVLTDTKRAGFERLYKEGIGFQPVRGLGFSGRSEIYEEPNPVESLVLDAKKLNFQEFSQYRTSVVPLFTRSAASRVVADYEPLPRFTYEYDARETLHQFQTQFGFKDIDTETHAINALYSLPEVPFLGTLSLNPWYKRVYQESDHDAGSSEHRNEVIMNLSLQQTDNIEYFFQYDGYDSHKKRTVGRTMLELYKGQVRLKVPKLKLFLIPSMEYSSTEFDPGDDEFIKKDFFVDWGFDITNRLRASSKEQLILTELTRAGSTPSNPETEVYNTFNKLSYELFPDFDVSLGFDYSRAAGMNSFNNYGLRAEVELFKPGVVRSRVGYEWHSYYNIDDELSLLYWRFFLFQ